MPNRLQFLSFLAAITFVLALWLLPKLQVPQWQVSPTVTDSSKRIQLENQKHKEQFNIENEARKTLAQILGGGFFLLTAYLTWRNVRASEKKLDQDKLATDENLRLALTKLDQDKLVTDENLKLAQASLRATLDKQIMERFSNATENLEGTQLSVRLGGIYGLERIAKDSPEDHWPVMEVLTAYVREKATLTSPLPVPSNKQHPRPPMDIQAVLTIIGRRKWRENESLRLDMHGTDLRWVRLRKAELDWVNFAEADLSGAKLEDAHLRSARLSGVNFTGANLTNVNFSKSDRGPRKSTRLVRAILSGADLTKADLSEANLEGADFTNAILTGTILNGANLKKAAGLTQAQINVAIVDQSTQLAPPLHI